MLLLLFQHNFTVCILSPFMVEVFSGFSFIWYWSQIFVQPNDAFTVTCSLKLSAKAAFKGEAHIVMCWCETVVIRSKCVRFDECDGCINGAVEAAVKPHSQRLKFRPWVFSFSGDICSLLWTHSAFVFCAFAHSSLLPFAA